MENREKSKNKTKYKNQLKKTDMNTQEQFMKKKTIFKYHYHTKPEFKSELLQLLLRTEVKKEKKTCNGGAVWTFKIGPLCKHRVCGKGEGEGQQTFGSEKLFSAFRGLAGIELPFFEESRPTGPRQGAFPVCEWLSRRTPLHLNFASARSIL